MTIQWIVGAGLDRFANFAIFNATYNSIDQTTCGTCKGAGGFISGEMQGDGYMTSWVETFEPCNECIGAELCPGCMQSLALSFDLSAFESKTEWIAYHNPYYATNLGYLLRTFDYADAICAMPFVGFTCLCCGWQYDPARHNDQYDEPDYYDDGDYDYPDYDASGYNLSY